MITDKESLHSHQGRIYMCKDIRTTQPIRTLDKINEMKEHLATRRDVMLFTLGINSGLRISDIIKLTKDDVKPVMELVEKKTGKKKTFQLSDSVYQMLEDYARGCDYWLFPSRKGDAPITTVQAWRIIKAAGNKCGLEHIGTHSMRKTFGYHAYRNGVSLAYLMQAFNHSSEAITMRYIGITEEELNKKVYSKMAL